MLVLMVERVLKVKVPDIYKDVIKSKHSLYPVLQISLGTTFLIVIVAAGLFVPPLFITQNPQLQVILWILASVLFLPIVFALSCTNIFTVFFVVLLKQKLPQALSLGTDFFFSRWTQILGLMMLLIVIYIACFFVGLSIIGIFKLFFDGIFKYCQIYTGGSIDGFPNFKIFYIS